MRYEQLPGRGGAVAFVLPRQTIASTRPAMVYWPASAATSKPNSRTVADVSGADGRQFAAAQALAKHGRQATAQWPNWSR